MLLQRQYARNADGSIGDVSGVKLKSGLKPVAHFTPELIRKATKQGWMALSGNKLTVSFVNAPDAVYTVVREPGYYCCHCKQEIEDANQILEGGITVGQRHVSQFHGGAQSPDKFNPSGYERINYYDCVKE